MKILLVATNRMMTPFPVYPIGVDYVATALRGRHEIRVMDFACEGAEDALTSACQVFAPDVVGLSIRNIDNLEAASPLGFIPEIERIVERIRAECGARIVLGGPGFSIFPEALMARLRADFGMVGEGERLAELLDALVAGALSGASAIPGVFVGSHRLALPEPWPGPPSRTLMSPETVTHYLRWGGMLNVQTKRGCPYLCSYCTYPGIEGRKLRLFDPDVVAAEWATLVAAGAKFLFVTDSVFNSHVQHNLAVAEALVRHGLTVPWGAFLTPTRPPRDYYRRLREAGLTHAEFGTESFSPAMLKRFRKPFTVEHALAAHAEARAAGLHVAHYIMLGGPGETAETVSETLDRCDAIDDAALFFFCGVRIFPSTQLHAIALREGQISVGDDLLEPCFYVPAGIGLEAMAQMVNERARGRRHWVTGSGSAEMAQAQRRMYQRGRVGPLWDRLVT
jgi:Radical SAM superfamily/B12 binding domain